MTSHGITTLYILINAAPIREIIVVNMLACVLHVCDKAHNHTNIHTYQDHQATKQTSTLPSMICTGKVFHSLMRLLYRYSRKFLSAKNFVKSDRVRQFVRNLFSSKCQTSLICSSVVWSLLFCLSFIVIFMKISDRTLVVF